MKEAVLNQINKPLEIENLIQEDPKYGEVKIKVNYAGICASDLHIMKGTASLPIPAVLGHEGSGTVVEVGPNVTNLKPGDRCIMSFVSNCGHCTYCRTGNPNLCSENLRIGSKLFDNTFRLKKQNNEEVYQMGKIGLFSEYSVCPQQACYPIPDEISLETAALIGCCATTGIGAVVNHPNATTGLSIAIFGTGGVGISAIQGAKLLNSSKIIAVDIDNKKLQFSKKFGATHTINAKEEMPINKILDLTNGEGVDMALDTFGSNITTENTLSCIRRGGDAVIVGLASEGEFAKVDMVSMVRKQLTLSGSYYGTTSSHETFKKIVTASINDQLDLEKLVTEKFPLKKINQAFENLQNGEIVGRGILEL